MQVDPTEQRSAEIDAIRRGRTDDRRRRERDPGFATGLRASILASTERLRHAGGRAADRHDANELAHHGTDVASASLGADTTPERTRQRRATDDDEPTRRDARIANADDTRPGGAAMITGAPAPTWAGCSPETASFSASELTPQLLDQIAERCVVDQSPLGAVRVRIDFSMGTGGRFGMDVIAQAPGQVALRFRGRSVPLDADDIDRIVSRLSRQGIRVVDTVFEQHGEDGR